MSSANSTSETTTEEKDQKPKESAEISDDSCSICIDDIKDMCYTDTCLHKFCFACLSEWVKRRHLCPMCKTEFTSIIHNIKSDAEYEITPLFPHVLAEALNEEENGDNDEDERQARQLQLLELGDLREDIFWLQQDTTSQTAEVQQIRSEITENLISVIDDVGRILDRL